MGTVGVSCLYDAMYFSSMTRPLTSQVRFANPCTGETFVCKNFALFRLR